MQTINLLGKDLVISEELERSNEVRKMYSIYANECKKNFIEEYNLTYKNINDVYNGVMNLGLRIIDEAIDKAVKYLIEKMVYTVDNNIFLNDYYNKYNTWEAYCSDVLEAIEAAIEKGIAEERYKESKLIQDFSEEIYNVIFDMNLALISALAENSDESYKCVSEKDISKTKAIYNNMTIIPDKEGALFQIIQLNPYDKAVYMFALEHNIGVKQEIVDAAHFFYVDISENFEEELQKIYSATDKSSEESILKVKRLIKDAMERYYIEKSQYLNLINEDWNNYDKEARTYLGVVYSTRNDKVRAERENVELEGKFAEIESLSLEELKTLFGDINKNDYFEEIKLPYVEKLKLLIQKSELDKICEDYKDKSLVELSLMLGKIISTNFKEDIIERHYDMIRNRIIDLKLNEKQWIYVKHIENFEYLSKGKAVFQLAYEDTCEEEGQLIEYSSSSKLNEMNDMCSESFSSFDRSSSEVILLNYNNKFMITDENIYINDKKVKLENIVDIYNSVSNSITITSVSEDDLEVKLINNIASKLADSLRVMIIDILSGLKYVNKDLFDISLINISQDELARATIEKNDLAEKCKNINKYSVNGLKLIIEEIKSHDYLEAIKEFYINKIENKININILDEKCKDIDKMDLEQLITLTNELKSQKYSSGIKDEYINKIALCIQKIKGKDISDIVNRFTKENRKYTSDKVIMNDGSDKFIKAFNKFVNPDIYNKKYEIPLLLFNCASSFIAITDKSLYCNEKTIELKDIKNILGEKLLFIGSIVVSSNKNEKINIQSDKNTVEKDGELLNTFINGYCK